MRRLVCVLAVWLFASHAQAVALPGTVEQSLKQAGIPLDSVAIEVRKVDARRPLFSLNAARPMNPASTMKLLTTYAALDMLGPSYAWKTEAWLDGELKDGVLYGDLVLKGYGDPKLTLEQFWLWLRELRARGLHEIRGDLVLDRSFFELPPHDPAAFDNDPLRAYNVGPVGSAGERRCRSLSLGRLGAIGCERRGLGRLPDRGGARCEADGAVTLRDPWAADGSRGGWVGCLRHQRAPFYDLSAGGGFPCVVGRGAGPGCH